jgi:hypothetical protein
LELTDLLSGTKDQSLNSEKTLDDSESARKLETSMDEEDLKKDHVAILNLPHCDGLIEDIPTWQKDNELILTGYRVNYLGFNNVGRTFFMFHNESVNVWSHFIGFLMFISAIIWVFSTQPNMYRQGKSVIKDFIDEN